MSDIFVDIEIQAMPWKKQDKQLLKLELDPTTSIIEIIEHLIEENKIKVDSDDILVYKGSTEVSKNKLISDFQTPKKDLISFRFKAKPAINSKVELSSSNIQSQHYPSKSLINMPTPAKISSNFEPNFDHYPVQKQRPQVAYQKKPSLPYSVQQSSIISKREQIVKQPISDKGNSAITTNWREEKSDTRNQGDDIEFTIDYRQGGYARSFNYSSRKIEEKSNQMSISKNSNNVIEISIVDNNRKISFKVDKL